MAIESGTDFLAHKYDLHNKPEFKLAVESAAARTNKRNELRAEKGEEFETVGLDPDSQIQNYLHRFTEITDREDPDRRKRGLDALKRLLYHRSVIKPENIPESYWQAHSEQAQQMGAGNVEITEDIKSQETKRVIADQKESLDRWIDYLTGPDAHYPDYLKYVTVHSILSMGNYDANRHTFTERTDHTVKRFPNLSRGALARTVDSIERYYGERYFALKRQLEAAQEDVKQAKNALSYAQKLNQPDLNVERTTLTDAKHRVAELTAQFEDLINGQAEENADQPKFNKALLAADFATLYALALEKSGTAKQELWPVTEGRWVTYEEGQANELVAALDGKGTDWCLEGTATSKMYLDKGNLLVYFSEDEERQPTIPRAGVWLVDDKVVESHGVDGQQNLDPYIADVVRAKAQALGDPNFEKRSYDMQMLTYIARKAKAGHELNKDDLIFLYEINSPIEDFGYDSDPRIAELRASRNPEEDAPIVLGCLREEIAHSIGEINDETKAYIGPLAPGIFNLLPSDIKYIYNHFPEKRVHQSVVEPFSPIPLEIWDELNQLPPQYYSNSMSRATDQVLSMSNRTESINGFSEKLVSLTTNQLGLTYGVTEDVILQRASDLGLKMCSGEAATKAFLNWRVGEADHIALEIKNFQRVYFMMIDRSVLVQVNPDLEVASHLEDLLISMVPKTIKHMRPDGSSLMRPYTFNEHDCIVFSRSK